MKYIFTLLAFIAANTCFAQNKEGILYGDNHAYGLVAPKGWILDNKAAAADGIHAVFYPTGESWQNAVTVMYTNTAPYGPGNENTDVIIKYDLDRFIAAKPGIDIRTLPPYKLEKGKKAEVRHIYSDAQGNYEAIAYITESKVAVLIVLSSKTKEGFENNLLKFNELLDSYTFITDDVEIKQ